MPIDMKASPGFLSCDQRSEEDYWCAVQFRVSLNLCGDFASVPFWHYHIKQDQVRPKISCAQMSSGAVVFFQHQVSACLLEKDFDQVSAVRVVINNQNASHV